MYTILKAKLDMKKTLESGQVFRYVDQFPYFILQDKDRQVVVEERKEDYLLHGDESDLPYWIRYFDLARDYDTYHRTWRWNPVLERAYEYGKGIRILRQDPFETMITFILSANSHVPRIKQSVESLCRHWGRYIDGTYPYYTFPSPKDLAKGSIKEFRELAKVGYRDRYVYETAQKVASKEVDLKQLETLQTKDLIKKLKDCPGVGEKVAQCIALFGFGRLEGFPIDVWMKKMLLQGLGEEKIPKDPVEFGKRTIGEGAGLAQQYYFYYIRTKGEWK